MGLAMLHCHDARTLLASSQAVTLMILNGEQQYGSAYYVAA
jgi:hypothetical protein